MVSCAPCLGGPLRPPLSLPLWVGAAGRLGAARQQQAGASLQQKADRECGRQAVSAERGRKPHRSAPPPPAAPRPIRGLLPEPPSSLLRLLLPVTGSPFASAPLFPSPSVLFPFSPSLTSLCILSSVTPLSFPSSFRTSFLFPHLLSVLPFPPLSLHPSFPLSLPAPSPSLPSK